MSAINKDLPNPATLTLREAADSEEADIKLGFLAREHGDGRPFDAKKQNEFAHAFYPFVTKDPSLHGSIHFDAAEKWQTTGPDDIFPFVALHELGHALGLPHATIKDSVMYPTIDGPSTFRRRQLYDADEQNIRNLYRKWVAV